MKRVLSLLTAILIVGLIASPLNAYAYLDFGFAESGNIGDYEERPEYAYNDPKNGTNVTYTFDSVTGTLVISHNPNVDASGNMASYNTSPFAGKTEIKHIIVNEGVTGFCAAAFNGCTGLLDVSLPASLTGIADGAFEGCTALQSLTVKENVKTVGSYAFSGCTALKEVKLNNGLKEIDQYAFSNCGTLGEIVFPQSVTDIHAYAFSGSGIKSIVFDDSSCVIYPNAFNDCVRLTDADLGKNVTLNTYAFSYCTALKSIEIPGVNETIPENVLYSCTALENVKMNEGTKTIDEDAFNECTAVKVVEIPKSLVTVSDYAFRKCELLSDVYYKGSQEEWNKITFGRRNEYLTEAKIHYNSPAPGFDACKGKHKWDGGKTTKAATYTATGVRTYTCTVCGSTKTELIGKLPKKANALFVKPKSPTVKYAKLRKKNQTIARKNAISVTKAKGTVSYAKKSGNKNITINKKTGKITIKKGLKKGTYTLKVKVKAAGNAEYKAAVKTVTVKIKVK
ncbi:MAG: leucine-rich repeat domain-containing protein [Eubacterium sp.]|nr:leucine-rich repeat domain-containing protein [Eubacterium sp.]